MDQLCFKCGEIGHCMVDCYLSIRNPVHVKSEWTCPVCEYHYEDYTESFDHEYGCSGTPSLSVSSVSRFYSHLQKKRQVLRASPKKCLASRS